MTERRIKGTFAPFEEGLYKVSIHSQCITCRWRLACPQSGDAKTSTVPARKLRNKQQNAFKPPKKKSHLKKICVSLSAFYIYNIFTDLLCCQTAFSDWKLLMSQISLSPKQPNSIHEIIHFTLQNKGAAGLPLP